MNALLDARYTSSACCCVHLEFNKTLTILTTSKATAQTVVNQKIGTAPCQNLPDMDNDGFNRYRSYIIIMLIIKCNIFVFRDENYRWGLKMTCRI